MRKATASFAPTERLTDYEAVGIAEGFEPCRDAAQYREAWQHLVDTGLCWRLPGWIGRTARAMLDAGELNEPSGPGVHTTH
jgi:hypothetical protein